MDKLVGKYNDRRGQWELVLDKQVLASYSRKSETQREGKRIAEAEGVVFTLHYRNGGPNRTWHYE